MTDQVSMNAEQFGEQYTRLKTEIQKVVVGHESVIEQVLMTIFAGGHALLEGVPGLGKTLLCKTIAETTKLDYKRIQFTPDLMPADILGTSIVVEDENRGKHFEFQEGPIFGNIVLADEINRATPKTQSALLEAMQEGQVTVSGRRELPQPFFVLATQNPIDMEGTYPLPEAQLDRFLFKIDVRTQAVDALVSILERTTGDVKASVESVLSVDEVIGMRRFARQIPVAQSVLRYAARICQATHPESPVAIEASKKFVRFGSSPRGAQSMVLAAKVRALIHGRLHVDPEDIRATAVPALRHRMLLNFEGEAEGIKREDILGQIIEQTPDTDPAVQKLLGR
ncbi:MAG: MoxR family ATPase [Planctomycetota bacterium]|nr:MoxR family ATPase [Planctomycetota bacterium]